MVKCKKCETNFEPQKGLKSFCSLSCRNSRVRTDEIKNKISEGVKNSEKFKQGQINRNKFIDYKKIAEKNKESWNKKILNAKYETLSFGRLKKRIKLEQKNKCNKCGINSWNDKPITLELEHKDGNNQNNKRENLECLCPNCHSQTSTWRGKNKTNKRNKISDDEIVKSYLKNKNIRQTLIEVGLSPKGGNYKRLHHLIKKYNLI
jgi:Zn finger protein HypA/HybF involved in hydrogenase expression